MAKDLHKSNCAVVLPACNCDDPERGIDWRARAEAAESALAAVRALADEWESGGSPLWRGIAAPILRAALAAEADS